MTQLSLLSAPTESRQTAKHPEHCSPSCAMCGLAARSWSGVEDWKVDGLWIGWCGPEHRRRWLRGQR